MFGWLDADLCTLGGEGTQQDDHKIDFKANDDITEDDEIDRPAGHRALQSGGLHTCLGTSSKNGHRQTRVISGLTQFMKQSVTPSAHNTGNICHTKHWASCLY